MSAQEQLSFKALADPTRREILFLLAKNEMTIADVADNFQMTRAAVKKHLSILREGDLIRVRAAGRTKLNSLNPDGMKRVTDWIRYFDAFWDTRLNALKSEIEKELK
ncbi:MAG: ArsR/SmtB family transcription factor [Paracoccaceae bacterium]